MIKKMRSIAPIALGFCMLVLPLSGCAPADRNRDTTPGQAATPVPGQNLTGQNLQGVNPPGVYPTQDRMGVLGGTPAPNQAAQPAPQLTTPQATMQTYNQRATNIRNQLATMNEIARVNAIVIDNTAVVGFTPKNTGADMNTLKRMIAERVRQIDPAVTNVTVSETADTMNKVNQLSNDMTNNRPINEIRTEVNQLMQRIAPTLR